MAEGLTGAGDYQLEILDLITVAGLRVDLKASCFGLIIYEDLFSLTLTGTIAISDSVNLASFGPIIGQEYLYLKIKTPSLPDTEVSSIDFSENVFLIHTVSSRRQIADGVQGYVFSFVSQELVNNQRLKVTQSLTASWSDIVEKMLRDSHYLNTKKNVTIERTAGVKRFVAPNIRPLDLVVLGTKQAYSTFQGEPNFLFYENFEGFNFRSVASLYNNGPTFNFRTVPAGTNTVGAGRNYDIVKEMETILEYEIISNNDTIVGYRSGMYGSKLITHDIVNKSYDTHIYNYLDQFSKEKHIVGGVTSGFEEHPFISDLYVSKEGRLSDFHGRTYVMPVTNKSGVEGTDGAHTTSASTQPFSSSNPKHWLQRRNSQMLQLENAFNINLKVHGNTMVRIGDVVTVKIPYITASSLKKEQQFDKFYNGPFLVKRIRHDFSMVDTPRKHTMHMSLVKDSLEERLPSRDDNMEPSAASHGSSRIYSFN